MHLQGQSSPLNLLAPTIIHDIAPQELPSSPWLLFMGMLLLFWRVCTHPAPRPRGYFRPRLICLRSQLCMATGAPGLSFQWALLPRFSPWLLVHLLLVGRAPATEVFVYQGHLAVRPGSVALQVPTLIFPGTSSAQLHIQVPVPALPCPEPGSQWKWCQSSTHTSHSHFPRVSVAVAPAMGNTAL